MKSTHTVRGKTRSGRERPQQAKRNTVISLKEERPKEAKTPLRRLARTGPVASEGPGAVRNPEPKAPRQSRARSAKPTPRRAAEAQGPKAKPSRKRRIVLSTPRNALPGWHDLASGEKERHRMRARHTTFLETISTTRFAALILTIAIAFTMYVGHVHATQDLLAELQRANKENLRLHLRHNRLKGVFDQATGPAVIYQRAKELGLEEGIAYGPTIDVAVR